MNIRDLDHVFNFPINESILLDHSKNDYSWENINTEHISKLCFDRIVFIFPNLPNCSIEMKKRFSQSIAMSFYLVNEIGQDIKNPKMERLLASFYMTTSSERWLKNEDKLFLTEVKQTLMNKTIGLYED